VFLRPVLGVALREEINMNKLKKIFGAANMGGICQNVFTKPLPRNGPDIFAHLAVVA
jgi:hypothetical protein